MIDYSQVTPEEAQIKQIYNPWKKLYIEQEATNEMQIERITSKRHKYLKRSLLVMCITLKGWYQNNVVINNIFILFLDGHWHHKEW